MALTIELGQTTKKDDGTYDIYLKAVRDNGEIVTKNRLFNVASAAELKSMVKPIFEKLVASEKNKVTVRAIAQGVIDEILSEVTQ